MSAHPVFAEASSRLHADIAIIRLIQAGIAKGKISAVFPHEHTPNSVRSWLKNLNLVPLTAIWPVAAAGVLGRIFRHGIQAPKIGRQMELLGFPSDFAVRIVEKVRTGQIVLCVHAVTESEASLTVRIFRQVRAVNVTAIGAETVRIPAIESAFALKWSAVAA